MKIVFGLLGSALALFWVVPALERRLVYWPIKQDTKLSPADFEIKYQNITVKTSDKLKLHSWLLTDDTTANQPWLIYFHGNASNISKDIVFAKSLHQLGYNILMAEYRGYYQNAGTPSEAGVTADALAYYHFLRNQGIAPKDIVLYGFSLGTGIATKLAGLEPVAGVILEAPYSSIPEAGRSQYFGFLPDWLFRQKLNTLQHISEINTPLLILHALDDRTVPFEHGQAIFAEANKPKTFIEIGKNQGGHLALRAGFSDSKILKKLEAFLASLK